MTRTRLLLALGVGLAVAPLACAAAWYALWELPARREAAALTESLRARSSDLAHHGWVRPVLRGTPLPGNAATEAQSVAEARTLDLDALARSTQHSVAALSDPLLDPSSPRSPDSGAHLRAVRVLLARARARPPAACLRSAADAIRLAQDHVSGGGILRLAIASSEIAAAVPVAVHCARDANPTELRTAGKEIESLARHPAPSGDALAGEALYAAGTLRDDWLLRPKWPLENPYRRLSAWRSALERADAFEHVDPSRYPEGLAELDAAAGEQQRSASTAALDLRRVRRHLLRDMESQAKLRALAVALLVRAGAPPPSLKDPFTGAGLRRESTCVWSAGENRLDDRGSLDDVAVCVR
ncbi:MAG: hypothetical protein KC776_11530 [Myxococcales bacterium]|nr:hypothetical protein [Myxococcales bacterium]